jgi:hypothetical protein
MLFKSKFTLLFLAVSAIPAPAFAESSNNQIAADEYRAVAVGVLPTVEVRGKRADKPFRTPSAVSHRDADELGQDANTLLRTMPGTFTQHDLGQGGFAVNIRGLEGFGRVNTTVDGVTQTFFQSNPAHGWNGNTTYVDENFIAGIDVSRGSVAGAGGVNALAGNAELRTLDVDDLVAKDRKFGFQTTYRQGTNGYGKNGMVGAAVCHEFENGGSIGFLSAISGKRKSGYKNGAGEVITGDEFDADTAAESGIRSWGMLNKLHIRPSRYHSIMLGHMMNRARFTNNHSPLQVNTQTGLLKYRYNPLSDWVDLQLDASFSNARQKFLQGESAREDYVGRTTRSPTTSLTLQNRSTTDIGNSELSLNYGAKFMRTRYNSNYENNTSCLPKANKTSTAHFSMPSGNPENGRFMPVWAMNATACAAICRRPTTSARLSCRAAATSVSTAKKTILTRVSALRTNRGTGCRFTPISAKAAAARPCRNSCTSTTSKAARIRSILI